MRCASSASAHIEHFEDIGSEPPILTADLPIKAQVQRRERIEAGDTARIVIQVDGDLT